MPFVPDRTTYDPVLDAYLHIGSHAGDAAIGMPHGIPVALDIETPGLDRAFEINCVTAAWWQDGRTHSVLLDPVREPTGADANALRWIVKHAGRVIFHNAPFDVPALYNEAYLGDRDFDKITDTILLARLAYTNPYDRDTGSKKLSDLATRMLDLPDYSGGLEKAFKAAGYRTIQAGFEGMDIDSPIYRLGAMSDTVATLRLEPTLRDACRDLLTRHPFESLAPTTDEQAAAVIATQETVHRVMLLRTAKGIAVDTEYLEKYRESVHHQRAVSLETLQAHGLDGGSGKAAALVTHLDSIGELPDNWPRTATDKLQATKELLDRLDHPLATAQRFLADTDKVLGYLDKVARQAQVTGRCHPQVGVLGATQTGRMSYKSPELQQFSADARPILIDDNQGLTSIDWSQIEPVTMGLLAKDPTFLAPYEAGEDLYGPIQTACGIDRKLAKVVLLATMYGQGTAGLSGRINKTQEQAGMIRKSMLASMPESANWMNRVTAVAEQYGMVPTAGGRILAVDSSGSFRAVNYMVQGSAYDVLAHTIAEMHRRGISEHLYLAMHDEVVVSTPVAAEVQDIMQTPPPWLTKAAGRTPILRTDREDLGGTWLKV